MGFLPLDLAKIIYGGFNPQGTNRDPFISIGRSISHGVRPSTGDPDLSNPNYIGLGDPTQPQSQPVAPAQAAAQAYASVARQPEATGGFGRTAADTQAYFDPHSANMFAAGLQNWNGPGQVNPIGGEEARGSTQWLGLARRLGGMGIQGHNTPTDKPAPNWATAHLPKLRGRG